MASRSDAAPNPALPGLLTRGGAAWPNPPCMGAASRPGQAGPLIRTCSTPQRIGSPRSSTGRCMSVHAHRRCRRLRKPVSRPVWGARSTPVAAVQVDARTSKRRPRTPVRLSDGGWFRRLTPRILMLPPFSGSVRFSSRWRGTQDLTRRRRGARWQSRRSSIRAARARVLHTPARALLPRLDAFARCVCTRSTVARLRIGSSSVFRSTAR